MANNVQRAGRYSHCNYKSFSWGTNANKQEDCFIVFAGFNVDVSGWELYLPLARSSRPKMKTFSVPLKVLCDMFGKCCLKVRILLFDNRFAVTIYRVIICPCPTKITKKKRNAALKTVIQVLHSPLR